MNVAEIISCRSDERSFTLRSGLRICDVDMFIHLLHRSYEFLFLTP